MHIDSDIRRAHTLPTAFYREEKYFSQVKEKIFATSWLYVAGLADLDMPGKVMPLTLLPGVLDEPLVITCDKAGEYHCLSNVCTHRGHIVATESVTAGRLSCGYHGRCFHLDGRFMSMPEFEQTEGFPTADDDLVQLPLRKWLGMFFVSLNPSFDFEEATWPIRQRVDWLPLDTLVFEATGTKEYPVNANWALYCDNYLEGFHIPFVHPALNQALAFGQYDYEIFRWCNLQLGIAKVGEPCFDIPEGHPDFGKKVYAWYFWLFPNLMLNFYPWGLSLNVVEPLSHDRTKVSFRTYRFKNRPFGRAANNLEQTEIEDEEVVERVQKGIQSRFYNSGRFSPTMEQGVHHFHRLISEFLKD
ncbi:MAG: aromatic ring-hydroxylating dioxygenase subunit alpha [Saprospiraceae bacterium]